MRMILYLTSNTRPYMSICQYLQGTKKKRSGIKSIYDNGGEMLCG